MRRFPRLWAIVFLASRLSASEQEGPTDPTEMEVFLDSLVAAQMDSLHLPGVVVSVVKDGGIFFTKGYGYADVEQRHPIVPERSVFGIGSISKLFVATAVMQLIDQGKLRPDDTVNSHLKLFQLPDKFAEPTTVHHLLTHTAGFEDHLIGIVTRDSSSVVPLGSFLKQGMPRQVVPPGQFYNYSNHGMALAGHLVEQISGLSFDDYVDREILTPLDMTRSGMHLSAQMRSDLALGYGYNPESDSFQRISEDYLQISPAGGLYATATDMAHFMIAHLQDGRYQDKRILSESAARQMRQVQHSNHPGQWGIGYAFTETYRNGLRVWGHDGGRLGYFSFLFIVPEENLGFFVSTNTYILGSTVPNLEDTFLTAFLDHYYESADEDQQALSPIDPHEIDRWSGTYQLPRYSHHTLTKISSLIVRVNVLDNGDGSLGFVLPVTNQLTRWMQAEPGVYKDDMGKGSISFRSDNDGNVTHMSWNHILFERTAWHQATMLHLGIIGYCILMFSSASIWPIGYFRRRRRGKISNIPWPRRPHVVAGAVVILNLAFVLGLLIAVGSFMEITYSVPLPLIALLCLPVVAGVLTIVVVVFVWRAWNDTMWSLASRLHYSAVAAGAVLFTAFLHYWNLLGFRF